jgi:beta-1,2-mannosidase
MQGEFTSMNRKFIMKSIIILSGFLLSAGMFGALTQTQNITSDNWAAIPFVKQNKFNPILKPKADSVYTNPLSKKVVHWESGHIYNPTAIIKNGEVYLLYRAQSNTVPPSPSVVGLAKSSDGIHFERLNGKPILYPEYSYEKDGCEDPRIVTLPNGEYLLMYSAYDGKTARLCSALSKDLVHWKKLGPVFKGKKYENLWSKSGALITELKGNNFVAEPIKFEFGTQNENSVKKFGMFWGDTDIFFATATLDNLLKGKWKPIVGKNGFPKPVITPRAGLFDSRLCESGPAAISSNGKTLLLYNGMNLKKDQFGFCENLTSDEYTSGQIQVKTTNPFDVLHRLDIPFMKVTENYEKKGLVNNVVFIEGMVCFHDKYYLYYGCGDSLLALAVHDLKNNK